MLVAGGRAGRDRQVRSRARTSLGGRPIGRTRATPDGHNSTGGAGIGGPPRHTHPDSLTRHLPISGVNSLRVVLVIALDRSRDRDQGPIIAEVHQAHAHRVAA